MFASIYRKLLPGIFLILSSTAWAADSYYIDVRTDDEFNSGHVSVAHHIPYDEIAQGISEITADRDAEIFLYCRSGKRAGLALEVLEEMGYTNVHNLLSLEEARIHASKNAESNLIFD